ncbi:MAG: hypothetical protein ACI90V_012619, partial [Bacillariaceae sp.]
SNLNGCSPDTNGSKSRRKFSTSGSSGIVMLL